MKYIHGISKKPDKKAKMEEVWKAAITCEAGLVGDPRGDGGRNRKRQVTILSLDQWQETCTELDVEISWLKRRANICVSNLSFSAKDIGRILRLGSSVELEITGETVPCARMDEAHLGLQKALSSDWRGGVTCRVLKGGTIRQADEVYFKV